MNVSIADNAIILQDYKIAITPEAINSLAGTIAEELPKFMQSTKTDPWHLATFSPDALAPANAPLFAGYVCEEEMAVYPELDGTTWKLCIIQPAHDIKISFEDWRNLDQNYAQPFLGPSIN